MSTTTEGLKAVKNNLNAIRIQQQTAGKRRVAFPVEPFSGASNYNFKENVESDIEDAIRTEEEDIRSETDASTGYTAAEAIAAKMKKQIEKLGKQPTSAFDPIIDTTDADTEAAAEEEETKSEFSAPLLPPRGRRGRSAKKSATELKKELRANDIPFRSGVSAEEVRDIAKTNGISLNR